MKLLGKLAVVFFLLVPVLALANQAIFQDVAENHLNFYAIKSLKELGVAGGYPDSTFRPSEKISRAEALALLLKTTKTYRQARANISTISPENLPTDIPVDAWFREFVAEGIALNIVSGYADKTFKPLEPVRLPEALKMGVAAFELIVPEAKSGSWYERYFRFAEEKNLIDPDETGKLAPHKFLTRGEMAELIFRLKFVKEQRKAFDPVVEWNTFSHDANYFEVKYPPLWHVFKGAKNSALFRPDPEHGQIWMGRITPLSARLTLSAVEGLPYYKEWFPQIRKQQISLHAPKLAKKTSSFVRFEELVFQGGKVALVVEVPRKRFLDTYFALGNGRGLVMYGEYGKSGLSPFLKKQLETIIRSYRYIEPAPPSPPPLTPEQKLEKIRELILIEGKGPDALRLVPDKKLIETDAIGVGTGPVDYFYSKEINATIKYERSAKTILSVREEKTTKF